MEISDRSFSMAEILLHLMSELKPSLSLSSWFCGLARNPLSLREMRKKITERLWDYAEALPSIQKCWKNSLESQIVSPSNYSFDFKSIINSLSMLYSNFLKCLFSMSSHKFLPRGAGVKKKKSNTLFFFLSPLSS